MSAQLCQNEHANDRLKPEPWWAFEFHAAEINPLKYAPVVKAKSLLFVLRQVNCRTTVSARSEPFYGTGVLPFPSHYEAVEGHSLLSFLWEMHETKWIFFPSPLFVLDIPGVQVCTWGGLPLFFSPAQAAEAKNASFALMSDVFMRGLQCHPPWGSCEVAAHVCGAIYSMMKWGDLCWFHIHLPCTHTCTWTRCLPRLYCDCMSQLIPACIKSQALWSQW